MPVTADTLAGLLPTLTKQQVAVLIRSVLGLRTEAQKADIALLDCLRAGLCEFMIAVGFVTDLQSRSILTRMNPILQDVIPIYESGVKTLPTVHVVFAEQRWVAHPGSSKWYDMVYDEEVDELPTPAVLLVVCDVTALFLRQKAWLAKLGSGKDAEPEHHAKASGTAGQPDGQNP